MTRTKQNTAPSNNSACPRSNPASPSLADELLRLDDDFTEFSEISAFLCHAFAVALVAHESLNKDVISGARRCANWLQFRSEELKDDIRHVHARYTAEQKKVGAPS